MADFNVGSAWINLQPSAKTFGREAKAKLEALDLTASVDLEADAKKLDRAITDAKADLAALRREKASPSIDLDISVAEARAQQLRDQLEGIDHTTATPAVRVQAAEARRELDEVEKHLALLNERKATIDVDADIAKGEASLAKLEAKAKELDALRVQPQVMADTTQAEARLAELDGHLDRLAAAKPKPEVELQIAKARQEAQRIRAEIERLSGLRATAQVDADIAAASARLAVINQQLSKIDGRRVNANVGIDGGGNATLILAAIVAALGAIAAAAPAAVAALGAVAGAAGAIGQGAVATVAGFSGIGDAIKAVEQQEKSASSTAASSANKRSQAAKQIASSQRALGQAQTQADRAAITGAQQVASSRRALADTITSTASRISSAERSVETSQRARLQAQESLTEAVKDATRANRDLQLSVAGAGLSEERARLSLAQARARLADSDSTDPLERADLALSVREAEQNLKEVQTRYGDLKADQSDWARSGVMGSKQVRAAMLGVQDSQRAVDDSYRALAEAQASGARAIADAQESVAQAQQQAAWQAADSQRAIVDAQRQVAEAYETTGDAASSGANKAADALGELTPAGRDFVKFMIGEWKPAWERTSDAIADEMLPRIQRAMRNTLQLEPLLRDGLTESGRIVGRLAEKGSLLASSPPFASNFASILSSNNRAMSAYGDAGLHVFGALTDVYTAAGPVVEEFARLTDYGMEAFESWAIGAHASGELERYLQQAGDVLRYVSGWIVDVGGDVLTFAGNLAPLGTALLELVRYTTDFIAAVSSVSPALTSVVGGLGLAAVAASKLGTAMAAAQTAGSAGGMRNFASVLGTMLNPRALAASDAMVNLRDKVSSGAQKLGVSAGAATKAGNAIRGFGSALPLVGAAVTGFVIANDAMYTSFEEGIDAFGKGGLAAAKFRAELDANQKDLDQDSIGLYAWTKRVIGGVETTDTFTAKLAEQRKEWSSLQNAQYDAGIAQGDYEQAVRDFGPTSTQAQIAQGKLATETGRVAREQEAARRATMNATEALEDQQSKILSSISARLGLEQSVRDTADAQKAYNDAVSQSGPDSAEAADALGQLQSAQVSQAQAAMRAAEEEAKKRGETDTSIAANKAYAESIGDMVAKSKGQLTPALQDMVQGLDAAGLSAAGATLKVDDTGRAVAEFPDGKTVVLDAKTSQAIQGLDGVQNLLAAVPGNKQVTVGVLDEAAQQKLRDLGFTVTTLPDGQVQVTANDEQARNRLWAFQEFAKWQTANPQLAADPAKANATMRDFLVKAGEQTGVPALDADPARADQTVRDALDTYNRTWATVPVNADTEQADKDVRSWWEKTLDWLGGIFGGGADPSMRGAGRIGGHTGGEVHGYRNGGPIGFARGGRPPGLHPADTVPAYLQPGEFVVRKRAVDAIGLGALEAINGMRTGGLVFGYAAGGTVRRPQPGPTPAAAPAPASPAAPATGGLDATAAAADGLASSQAALTSSQQAMVSGGITPLVSAVTGSLLPALAAYDTQIGSLAPAANAALQTSQLATATTTNELAANTSTSSAVMAGAVTGMSSTAQAQHAALRAGQAATQTSTTATAANTASASARMANATASMSSAAQAQHAALRVGQTATRVSNDQTALSTAQTSGTMSVAVGNMSRTAQDHLANVRASQSTTRQSTTNFADSWRDQLARTKPDSGDPIRWVIDFPIRSLTEAWNNLDSQFSLNKHVNPYVPRFATGGHVSGPGGGTADRVPAMLSNGEFVVREKVAAQIPHFLRALNAGQSEAMQAAGVRVRTDPMLKMADGGSVSAAILRATSVAKSMSGKPYVWGGFGPAGADCSGYQSIITNALRGEANIYRRIGTTGSFPWPGFANGLGGAYAVGAFKGNPGHMAGTLAGVNVESGGSPSRVKYGAGAVGADSGQFNIQAFLPAVGGKFVSGGAGGGSFDIGPIVDEVFKKTYGEIDDVTKYFGPSPQVGRDQGTARFAADKTKEHATKLLSEMFAFSGGGDVEAFRPLVLQALRMVGQPESLVDVVLRRMNQESSGNPTIVNNWDSNARAGWPTKGLMQMRDDTFLENWDPRTPRDIFNPLSNIVSSMHYAMRRYGSLAAAYNKAGGYDNGGLIMPGRTLVENRTGAPERVLDNVETRSYDTLTRLLGRSGVRVDVNSGNSDGANGRTWNLHNPVFQQPVDVDTLMQRADFNERTAEGL